jgi:hypothetical protein
MKVRLSHSALLALGVFCGSVEAQNQSRQLSILMSVSGTCSSLVITGEALPCDGTVLHTEYDDGRIGFYFVASGSDGSVITFSGNGRHQTAPADNVRVQPIDAIILSDGHQRVNGSCLFENPFAGSARIECAAETPSGAIYDARFLSDGAQPEIIYQN